MLLKSREHRFTTSQNSHSGTSLGSKKPSKVRFAINRSRSKSSNMKNPETIMYQALSMTTMSSNPNFQAVADSSIREDIQKHFKKLQNNFHSLTNQDKLKIISPLHVNKVHLDDFQQNLEKDLPIIAGPKKSPLSSEFQPGNLVFPSIIPRRKSQTADGQTRPRHQRRRTENNTQSMNNSYYIPKGLDSLNVSQISMKKEISVDRLVQNASVVQDQAQTDHQFFRAGSILDSGRSGDSDVIFNFKVKMKKQQKPRYKESNPTEESDSSIPKEGSLLKYFRAKKLRPSTAIAKLFLPIPLPSESQRAQTSALPTRSTRFATSGRADPTSRDSNLPSQEFMKSKEIEGGKEQTRPSSSANVTIMNSRPSTSANMSMSNSRPSTAFAFPSKKVSAGNFLESSVDMSVSYNARSEFQSRANSHQGPRIRPNSSMASNIQEEPQISIQENYKAENRKRDTDRSSPVVSDTELSEVEDKPKVPALGDKGIGLFKKIFGLDQSANPTNKIEENKAAPLLPGLIPGFNSKKSLSPPKNSMINLNFTGQPIPEKSKIDETERDSRTDAEQKEDDKEVEKEPEKEPETTGPISADMMLEKIVSFMRAKMRTIEKEFVASDMKLAEIEGGSSEIAKMNAIAQIVDLRGGVNQEQLRPHKEMEHEKERVDIIEDDLQHIEETIEKLGIMGKNHLKDVHEGWQKALKTVPYHLSEVELEFIRDEYKQMGHNQSLNKIDEILKQLQFFNNMQKDVRYAFYKNATYVRTPHGHYMVKNGNYNNYLYVILRGGVDLKIVRRMKDSDPCEVTIGSLYDGHHFGDVAMIDSKSKKLDEDRKYLITSLQEIQESLTLEAQLQHGSKSDAQAKIHNKTRNDILDELELNEEQKRDHYNVDAMKNHLSIYTAEPCEFLIIDRKKFKEILVSVLQDDVNEKMKILKKIKIFEEEDDTEGLVPLANNIANRTYLYGQRIIKTGEIPDKMYIVAKGRCKAVYEMISEDPYYIPWFQKKLQPFKFKEFGGTEKAKINIDFEELKNKETILKMLPKNPNCRTFNNEPVIDDKDAGKNLMRKHILIKEFGPGEFFGIRSVTKSDELDYLDNDENRSKLSIIADTPEAQVYVMERRSLLYLPDRIKTLLLQGLSEIRDYDEGDIESMLEEHKEWHEYKTKLLHKTLSQSMMSTNLADDYKVY